MSNWLTHPALLGLLKTGQGAAQALEAHTSRERQLLEDERRQQNQDLRQQIMQSRRQQELQDRQDETFNRDQWANKVNHMRQLIESNPAAAQKYGQTLMSDPSIPASAKAELEQMSGYADSSLSDYNQRLGALGQEDQGGMHGMTIEQATEAYANNVRTTVSEAIFAQADSDIDGAIAAARKAERPDIVRDLQARKKEQAAAEREAEKEGERQRTRQRVAEFRRYVDALEKQYGNPSSWPWNAIEMARDKAEDLEVHNHELVRSMSVMELARDSKLMEAARRSADAQRRIDGPDSDANAIGPSGESRVPTRRSPVDEEMSNLQGAGSGGSSFEGLRLPERSAHPDLDPWGQDTMLGIADLGLPNSGPEAEKPDSAASQMLDKMRADTLPEPGASAPSSVAAESTVASTPDQLPADDPAELQRLKHRVLAEAEQRYGAGTPQFQQAKSAIERMTLAELQRYTTSE